MKIFIAGALSSKEDETRNPTQVVVDYIANVHKMCKAAGVIRKKGHTPFIPALDFLAGVICGDWTETEYRGMSDEFLPACDAMIVISMSWGVEREIVIARRLGIPIYCRLEDIPDA